MIATMKRREFITLLGGAAAWPLAARAQSEVRRISVLIGDTDTGPFGAAVPAFKHEMQKLGWNDGSNTPIFHRYLPADPNTKQANAAKLIAAPPELIVAPTNLVTTILQSEIRTIPIVFIGVSDPVGSGFVTEVARPTGNLTGFANFEPSMGGKWVEKLREIAPQVERIGFMLHPETPPNIGFLKSAEAPPPLLKIKVVSLCVHNGI